MNESRYLYEIALKAKEMAYAPYSGFKVGAAVLTDDGTVYFGSNIENASYGATVCAERVAIFKAISEGKKNITKIAIASDNENYTYPCGICRQVMAEFMSNAAVVVGNENDIKELALSELLPHSFTADDLK